MEEFKGTRGPWKVQESQSGKSNFNIIGSALGGRYKIARVPFVNEFDKPEAFRDAHLIAAAPELLDALQNLVKWETGTVNHVQAYKDAQSAINKALTIEEEEEDYDLPDDYEPNYDAPDAEERREQQDNWRSLK